MAAEWKEVKIGELGEVVGGATPSTKNKDFYGGDIAWITPKDLSNYNERYITRGERNITELGKQSCSTRLLPKNSILFSSRAPIGYIAIARNEMCTNQGFKSIIANADTDYLFLFYLLKFNKDKIEAMGSGTTFKEVSTKVMQSIKLKVPCKQTQQKIAKILSSLDEKIELNNKINENLHAQAQAIFKSWFVDFEPFGGTMPSDWEEVLLEEICTIQNGYAFKSNDYCKDGCKMVRVTNINDCYLENEDYINLPCSFYDDEKYRQFQLKSFDILLVMVGATIGKIGIVTEKDLPCLQNQNLWRFRSKNNISQPYIYFTVNSINKCVCGWSTGSARDFYRKDIFAKAKCMLPPCEVLEKFNQIQLNLFKKISNNLFENIKLAQIRDTLLPKLMSGELEV